MRHINLTKVQTRIVGLRRNLLNANLANETNEANEVDGKGGKDGKDVRKVLLRFAVQRTWVRGGGLRRESQHRGPRDGVDVGQR